MYYITHVIEVRQTEEFSRWLESLRDLTAIEKIAQRIARLQGGLLGDVKPVGQGVSELRINYGPGYRVYFARKGKALVMLLAGGDKSTQKADIAKAKKLATLV